jgi:hypothetical protein
VSYEQKQFAEERFDPQSNGFGWFVHYRFSEYWCDVKAYEVVLIETDGLHGKPLLQRKDAMMSPEPVETFDEAEVYLDGYVKRDGCNEIGTLKPHLCDLEGIQAHCKLIEHVYRKSIELMGGDLDD